jgi:hypothetical protein
MHLVSPPVGIWNLGVGPVPEQEGLASGGGIQIENGLAVMIFHHQYQIRLPQVLPLQLAGAVFANVDAAASHQYRSGLVGRLAYERVNARGAHMTPPTWKPFKAWAHEVLGHGAATNVASANYEDPVEQVGSLANAVIPILYL